MPLLEFWQVIWRYVAEVRKIPAKCRLLITMNERTNKRSGWVCEWVYTIHIQLKREGGALSNYNPIRVRALCMCMRMYWYVQPTNTNTNTNTNYCVWYEIALMIWRQVQLFSTFSITTLSLVDLPVCLSHWQWKLILTTKINILKQHDDKWKW